MGQLAATFDEMVARIEAAFVARQRSEERMREFIADASHELRTPLTSIRGYIDVLLRGGARVDPATTEHALLATKREAERMSRLVTDLLTLARLDTGRPLETQSVNLIALAGECVDQARILAGERQVMMFNDSGGRLMVMGDPDRLKQVMLVLLDNALKYGRQTPDGWVRLSVSRRDGQAIVRIEDNGPGIAQADLPRLFERFYRAERAHARRRASSPGHAPLAGAAPNPQSPSSRAEGSGLGLSIAYAIAQAHGGTLTAQNAQGAGAVFTLTLPINAAAAAAAAPPARGSTRPGA
jgi:two-component system OmpR family sensor kinase